MYKITFSFIFFLGAIVTQGQYREANTESQLKHHQISVNGAATTWGFIFKLDGNLKWGNDSLGYVGRSSPAIQLAYDYHLNKKISFGILGSSQNLGMKIDYFIFENPNKVTRRFNDIDLKIKRNYVGLRFNYHFINNQKNDLYTGIRLGSVFWKLSPSITDTDLDSKLKAKFPGTFLPALALGYRYKIKEKIGMGIELSLGIPQLFSYGIDFRF